MAKSSRWCCFHRFQCLLLLPLTGPSLLLPPLAHHMDLQKEPDMELSLLYVLNLHFEIEESLFLHPS